MTPTILKPYESRRNIGLFGRAMFVSVLIAAAVLYGLMAVILPIKMLGIMVAPLLVAMGFILWMLPDTGGVQIARIQSLLVIYLGLSIAWPNYLAFNLPGLPWITPTRVTLLCLLAVFVLNFSMSREMRDEARDTVSVMPIYMKLFWVFWALSTFAMVFSDSLTVSVNRYVNNLIYWMMIFFAGALAARYKGGVTRVENTLVWSTIIVIVFSLIEARMEQVVWIAHLPPFLSIDPAVIELVMDEGARAGTDQYRVRGPYSVALYFSEFLTMAFPFFVHKTAQSRQLRTFLPMLAATLGMMVVMYTTGARSAMVGMVVVLTAYPLYVAMRSFSSRNRSIVGSAVVYGYPAIAAVIALIVVFWRRAHVLVLGGGQHQSSSDARAEQWAMAWPKLASRPFGHGPARGNDVLGYVTPSGKGTVDSYYITVMLDSGYLALPVFLLVFLVPAFVAFKYFRTAKTPEMMLLAPLSLALINFTIVKGVLSSEQSIPLAFILIGCIVGLVWQEQHASKSVAVAQNGKVAPTGPVAPARPVAPLPPRRRFVPALAGQMGRR